jgi:enoyl-CoA hydratase/carnithine racemase
MSRLDDYKDSYKTIKLDRDEYGILQFTMHNNGGPYVFNEVAKDIHKGGHGELGEALHEVAQDRDNRVVIITGTGNVFADLPGRAGWRGGMDLWEDLLYYGNRMLMDLLDIPAPVIFCLNGPALRHPEVPFTADIVLAAEDALIQDFGHFPNGLVPGDGVAVILPYLMGGKRGSYFHLTGQALTAHELKEMGLVNEIMSREQLLPRAHELARQMVKNTPLTLRYTRAVLTAPLKAQVQQYLYYGRALECMAAMDWAEKLGSAPDPIQPSQLSNSTIEPASLDYGKKPISARS